MRQSLYYKFLQKVQKDGVYAASGKVYGWLANKARQNFNRRAVLIARNYLVPNGWRNAVPQDANGNAIPWFTYPAIEFLKDILSSEMRVFEYGSGFSTVFFNSRAKEVISVEHNPDWAQRILSDNPEFDIRIRPLGSAQSETSDALLDRYEAQEFHEPTLGSRELDIMHGLLNRDFASYAAELLSKPQGYFDLIVVDGMARQLCGLAAIEAVAELGFIVLDNSDRWQYNSLQRLLAQKGFGRIDFWGPGPINLGPWCTSFYSRRFAVSNLNVERPAGSGDLGL